MAKQPTQDEEKPLVFDINTSDTTLGGMVRRRAEEASAHWDKKYDLNKTRQQNKDLYSSAYVQKKLRDDRYEEIFSDNKLFTAVRTILAFITSNMTKPDAVPANDDSLSIQFADDLKKILVEVAEDEYARDKVKLALQDLLTGQRVGVLKIIYDSVNEKICIEHIQPDAIVVGKRSKLREEPDFVQHHQEATIGDMVRKFPDKKDDIYKFFEVTKGVPSQLERVEKMTENWIFIEEEDAYKLAIVWMLGDSLVLGKTSDPNWMDNNKNVISQHMMPFIFFNFLNDGSGYIDETSFIEQAQYNQKQYDMRGQTIAENAAYAGSGVPVFAKDAIKEETAAKLKFSPTHRLLLNGDDVNKSFTTWNAGALPSYVFEDKTDMKMSVLDIFGTNQIQSGAESENKTLGQDVMLRNQAEGRQQELIDCIDNAMLRFYQLLTQMIYRYFDDVQYYNFIGDDGKFEHLAISQKRIADNLGLKIKIMTGSSLPVDRSQKIAQAMKLLEFKRIGTLRLYKELGIEDPEEAYKEYLREMLSPQVDLGEMDKAIYDREADEDLQLVVGGKQPKEREDISEEYLTHLQNYLLTQQYEMLPQAAQQRVSAYVADIIAQAERKLLKMEMQQANQQVAQPMPAGDPNDPNQQQPAPGGDPNTGAPAAPPQETAPPMAPQPVQ